MADDQNSPFVRAKLHFQQLEKSGQSSSSSSLEVTVEPPALNPFGDDNAISSKPQLPPRPQQDLKPPLPARPVLPVQNEPLLQTVPKPQIHVVSGVEDANRDPPFAIDHQQILSETTSLNTKLAIGRGNYVVRSGHSLCWFDYTTRKVEHGASYEPRHITSVCFAPSRDLQSDARYLWCGLSDGELQVFDMLTQQLIERRVTAHQHPIAFILSANADQSMLTIDDNGVLQQWLNPHPETVQLFSVPSLNQSQAAKHLPGTVVSLESPPKTLRVASKQTAAVLVNDQLWTVKDRWFEVTAISTGAHIKRVEVPVNVGLILCIAVCGNMVYTGHQDGKVCQWDLQSFQKVNTLDLGAYRVTSLCGVGECHLWVGFGTGRLCVLKLDTFQLIKDWSVGYAVDHLALDTGSLVHKNDRLLLASCGAKGQVQLWDALLPKDYKNTLIRSKQEQYCTFDTISLQVCSWNIDAQKPDVLEQRGEDAYFLDRWINSVVEGGAAIYVFTLQEIIDLESTGTAARGIFGFSGSQSASAAQFKENEQQNKHRATLWRDRLIKGIRSNFKSPYKVVESRNLVGLYTLIMCRESLLIFNISSALVSTGLGGTYGNKGAIVVRFCLSDTSVCIINAHLPAHQTKVGKRNVDAVTILKAGGLSPIDSQLVRFGDGSQAFDNEVLIFAGDLNYRIDLERDKVIQLAGVEDWPTLWAQDQLIKQRNSSNGGILKVFNEGALTFAPTYKYDRNSDSYDTSEKRRVPAYCDRILFRNAQLKKYGRMDCRVSDHRPIYAHLDIQQKSINQTQYRLVEEEVAQKWQELLQEKRCQANVEWLSLRFTSVNVSQVKATLYQCQDNVESAIAMMQ